ncbi:MAG: hypothetical protein IJT94_00110, partial [Oscillibacter sp.]|nr:hypothetical protein [Oscillibacter sp.]
NGPRKLPTGPGGEYVLRFRRGAHLKPTNRPLTYGRAEAVDHWFDEANAQDMDDWVRGVREYITTGRA